MQCQMMRWTLACAALSLSSCAQKPPVDSYCSVYNPVVVEKGDGAITAKPGPKRRILANELTYRDQCGRK
jgi:hypothetical protein